MLFFPQDRKIEQVALKWIKANCCCCIQSDIFKTITDEVMKIWSTFISLNLCQLMLQNAWLFYQSLKTFKRKLTQIIAVSDTSFWPWKIQSTNINYMIIICTQATKLSGYCFLIKNKSNKKRLRISKLSLRHINKAYLHSHYAMPPRPTESPKIDLYISLSF